MLVLRSLRIRALKREILRWFASPQQPYGDAWLAPVGKLKRESIRPRSLSSRRNKTRVNPTLNPRHVFESLEPRIVLAADLTFPPGASDLVLTYDTNSSQLLLAQTSDTDAIVSSAAASSASSGGVLVNGTSGDDTLRLDLDALERSSASFLVTINGNGTDTLVVESDANYEITGNKIRIESTEVVIVGFERLRIVGGDADNVFTIQSLSIASLEIDGGAGRDTIIGDNTDRVWTVAPSGKATSSRISLDQMERFVGGSGDDTYRFSAGDLGSWSIDETVGGIDALDFSLRSSGATVDLSSTQEQTVSSGFKLTLGSGEAIDNLIGTAQADTLTGNSLDNRIRGGGGNDALAGGAGDDVYLFESGWGTDSIAEEAGADSGDGIEILDFSAIPSALQFVVNASDELTVSDDNGNRLTTENCSVAQASIPWTTEPIPLGFRWTSRSRAPRYSPPYNA